MDDQFATMTLSVPGLGVMRRRPAPSRVVLRQGDQVLVDHYDPHPDLGLDPEITAQYWGERPWFLEPLPEAMERNLSGAGFDLEARRAAARGLAIAFPADVCATMASSAETLGLIYGLYEGYIPTLLPLLPVGRDLAACLPAPGNRVVGELRRPSSFSAAGHEIAIHARLSRAGLQVRPEPGRDGGKNPDFAVIGIGEECFVEAKTNPMADSERALAEARDFVSSLVSNCAGEGCLVHVRGTAALGDLFSGKDPLQRVREMLGNLSRECGSVMAAMRAASFACGVYSGGRLIEVHVRDEPQELRSQVAIDLWPNFPVDKMVGRVVRKAREANQQIPRDARGIVVVDVGSIRRLDKLAAQLRLEARSRPSAFNRLCCLVALSASSTPTSVREEFSVPIPVADPILTPLQRQVVEAVIGRPINAPTPNPKPRAAKPSDNEPEEFGPGCTFLVSLSEGR